MKGVQAACTASESLELRRAAYASIGALRGGAGGSNTLAVRYTYAVIESALLEVRLLPWRPQPRVMKASTLRETVDLDQLGGVDDIAGLVLVLALWLTILLAAPVLVIVLAALLFSVELPLLIGIGLLLALARFAGLVPWTVLIVNKVTGDERRESTRNVLRAVRRVREVNGERRVLVRWAWS